MKYLFSVVFAVLFFTASIFSQQLYWWELKQSGSSLGGPVDYMQFNSDVVYYGSNATIYKSTDRGETFSVTGTNVPGATEIKAIILDDYTPGTFLVAIESSPNDKIYKTTNDGATWILTNDEGQMSFFGIPMTQDPSHPDTIYTMINANFKRSTDFGSTWTTIASNFGPISAPCDIEVFPDTSIILIGDNGTGIFKSTDYGLTWSQTFVTSGEIPTVSVSFTNPGVAFATKWSGGGGLLKSTDYGETWTALSGFNGTNMWGVHIQPTDGNLVMTGCYSCGSTWRSKDEGATWLQISIPSTDYQLVVVDSITQFAAQGNGFYKLNSDFFIPVELTSFTAEANSNKIILHWTTASELNNSGFEVERSEDNQSFEKIGFVPGLGTTTEAKNYTYEIVDFTSGTQYYRLKQIDFDGTYEYTNSVEVTGITPSEFSLSQNYPNPFNPSTSIKFSLPVASTVRMSLYNLLGQEVTQLINKEMEAGVHTVNFNASGLPSGTYFYVLSANGIDGKTYNETKKMLLMK